MQDSYITVKAKEKDSKAILKMYKNNKKIIETQCFIGEYGLTNNKIEGDKKTPTGEYELGLAFGIETLELDNLKNNKIEYIKIDKELYWVDDIQSKWYNKLVNINKVEKDWKTAEHLIEYKTQYEYGLEIKINPKSILGKGSAIFLHCTNGKATSGCIAVKKEEMIQILKNIDKQTKINISEEKR